MFLINHDEDNTIENSKVYKIYPINNLKWQTTLKVWKMINFVSKQENTNNIKSHFVYNCTIQCVHTSHMWHLNLK